MTGLGRETHTLTPGASKVIVINIPSRDPITHTRISLADLVDAAAGQLRQAGCDCKRTEIWIPSLEDLQVHDRPPRLRIRYSMELWKRQEYQAYLQGRGPGK